MEVGNRGDEGDVVGDSVGVYFFFLCGGFVVGFVSDDELQELESALSERYFEQHPINLGCGFWECPVRLSFAGDPVGVFI